MPSRLCKRSRKLWSSKPQYVTFSAGASQEIKPLPTSVYKFSKTMHIKMKGWGFLVIGDDYYCLSIHPQGVKSQWTHSQS